MTERRRILWAWALYDWANSAWATAVLAGFFPVLFRSVWSAGLEDVEKTLALGVANSSASLLVAIMATFLGSWGDRRRMRKRLLLFFAALGISATACLAFVPAGAWPLAGVCFALAAIGFSCGNLFYDALIVAVSPPDHYARASSLGYALGYLGGGLFFAAAVAFVVQAERWQMTPDAAMRVSLLACALWWAVFALPLARWVPEPASAHALPVRGLWREVLSHRAAVLFLAGYFLYIDGVGSVIRMAGDFALAIGLSSQAVIMALLLVQFVAWPAAVLAGRLAERFGTPKVLLAQVLIFGTVCIAAAWLRSAAQFFLLAVLIGAVLGGVQALSRAYFARMVPEGESGGWFGFFNMFGKFAAVLGPGLIGIAVWAFHSPFAAGPTAGLLVFAGAALLARSMQEERREACSKPCG